MRVPPIQSHLRPVISDDRLSVNSNSRMAAAWVSFLGMVEHEAKPLQLVHGKFDPVSVPSSVMAQPLRGICNIALKNRCFKALLREEFIHIV